MESIDGKIRKHITVTHTNTHTHKEKEGERCIYTQTFPLPFFFRHRRWSSTFVVFVLQKKNKINKLNSNTDLVIFFIVTSFTRVVVGNDEDEDENASKRATEFNVWVC